MSKLLNLYPEAVVYFAHSTSKLFDAMKRAGLLRVINQEELARIRLHVESLGADIVEEEFPYGFSKELPDWPIFGVETEGGVWAVIEFPE